MKPLISIIIPVYNVKAYVGKCLDSIKRQKYENLDIIIVDDGSIDESGKICDEFAKNEIRARVFHKKNGGLSNARNFGIKKAKGEIIAFVDSDDFVQKEYVSAMYEDMEKNNVDMVICGYDLIKPKKEIISGKTATIKLLTKQENIDIVAWNKLYKKSLFIDNNLWFPEGKKYEDTLVVYKILAQAKKVSYLDKSLYRYVERKESIMKTEKTEDRLMARELAAKEAIEFFKNDIDLKQAAEVSLLLANYAFLDFAIGGKIDKKYGEQAKKWIKEHRDDFVGNKYITKKLRTYNLASAKVGGVVYWIFRKIIHE